MSKRFRVVVADFITELKPELAILSDIADIVALDAASEHDLVGKIEDADAVNSNLRRHWHC